MPSKDEIIENAKALDERRAAQIKNQVDAINRLMTDGSYDHEMRMLHERLAIRDTQLADARFALNGVRLDVLAYADGRSIEKHAKDDILATIDRGLTGLQS